MLRDWYRTLLRAAGAGIAVPAVLVVALLISSGVGGGGLRGLGQLFEGPTIPAASSTTPERTAATTAARSDLPEIPEPARPSRSAKRSTPAPSRKQSAAKRPQGRRPSTGRPTTPTSPTTPTTPGKTPKPTPAPTPTPTPTPQPPPASPAPAKPTPDTPADGLARQVGKLVTDVVRPVPVVGAPVADAVQSVIDLIAPPPKQAAPTVAGVPLP